MKIQCLKCGAEVEINPGALLAEMNRGHKKTLTDADRDRRRENLARARKSRWPQK